jgi:CRISPR-associated endonuclease/helicase Cas3
MEDFLKSAFRDLASSLGHHQPIEPYAYQFAIAETLLSGHRVVMRVPVTGGKSFTGWFPWLASRLHACDFPHHLLHVVPGSTFLHALHRQLDPLVRAVGGQHVGIQTTGDAFDPYFLSDATLTTTDQLLSVALHRPLGLHPGLSNINAGALLNAYLFFDELPAFASRETLVLWLGLLKHYYPTSPCLLGSAVLPRRLLTHIAELLGAEYIDQSDAPVGGRRVWATQETLSVEAILRQHRTRTVVVCNTVRGAQMLYRKLRQVLPSASTATQLLLLHQYLFYRDRQPVEERVAAMFTASQHTDAILVTTPGIEIGTTCSADTLITDPAPPDALLRRAGRCACFAGEIGRVIVARVSEYAPSEYYPAPPARALTNLLADGAMKSAAEELAALDTVWEQAAPEELPDALRRLPDAEEILSVTRGVITGNEQFPPRIFPRVGACLHRVPESVADPFELERFSLAVSSLERGWKQWQANGRPEEWFALIPQWPASGQRTPTWSPIEHPREFHAAARLVVLNAEATSYDPVIGLELAPGTAYQSTRIAAQRTAWSPLNQHAERYEEHAARTLDAFDHLAASYRYVLRHLGIHWRIPQVELERWLRLCILWHDAGKLTADWQRAASRWQTAGMRRAMPGAVYGRVDYQSGRDGEFPCPEHAMASGLALSRCLTVLLGNYPFLYQGTLAALCHHHGLQGGALVDLTPHPDAWETLLELAAPVVADVRQLRRLDRFGWTLHVRGPWHIPAHPPDDPDVWMAYSLLARAIRLADREMSADRQWLSFST